MRLVCYWASSQCLLAGNADCEYPLTKETILIDTKNILIVHPFGCLVSHVCERGIMKKLHELYPNVNIHTVEYDYDSTRALRESRILLGIGGKNAFF